jgi:hypothetical protein
MTDTPEPHGLRITRACQRARDHQLDSLAIIVAAVRVPAGASERRNPVVLVDAEIGPVRVTYAVVAMKRRRLAVRPPEAADRGEGIRLPPVLQELVFDAVMGAVKADPAAREVLARERPAERYIADMER